MGGEAYGAARRRGPARRCELPPPLHFRARFASGASRRRQKRRAEAVEEVVEIWCFADAPGRLWSGELHFWAPPRAVKAGEERHSTHHESCRARAEPGTPEPGSPVTWKKDCHCRAKPLQGLLRDVSVDELHLWIAHRGKEVTSAQMHHVSSVLVGSRTELLAVPQRKARFAGIARCD